MLPFEKNEDVVAVKVLKGKFIGYTLALPNVLWLSV